MRLCDSAHNIPVLLEVSPIDWVSVGFRHNVFGFGAGLYTSGLQ